ncbi:unnamed protein product [Closterium sp. Yama58-4]|nr:unnamed protein product [Closterium sp. Yama58-4]
MSSCGGNSNALMGALFSGASAAGGGAAGGGAAGGGAAGAGAAGAGTAQGGATELGNSNALMGAFLSGPGAAGVGGVERPEGMAGGDGEGGQEGERRSMRDVGDRQGSKEGCGEQEVGGEKEVGEKEGGFVRVGGRMEEDEGEVGEKGGDGRMEEGRGEEGVMGGDERMEERGEKREEGWEEGRNVNRKAGERSGEEREGAGGAEGEEGGDGGERVEGSNGDEGAEDEDKDMETEEDKDVPNPVCLWCLAEGHWAAECADLARTRAKHATSSRETAGRETSGTGRATTGTGRETTGTGRDTTGTGAGTGAGTGVGTGIGTGVGTGIGTGVGTGIDSGAAVGTARVGKDAGATVGTASEAAPGDAAGVSAAVMHCKPASTGAAAADLQMREAGRSTDVPEKREGEALGAWSVSALFPGWPALFDPQRTEQEGGGLPPALLASIESLRLSRRDIVKIQSHPRVRARVVGFFLRLRLGKKEEDLGGTGYRMAKITGVVRKQAVESVPSSADSGGMALTVDMGDGEYTVDGHYVSNKPFLEVEVVEWCKKIWQKALSFITLTGLSFVEIEEDTVEKAITRQLMSADEDDKGGKGSSNDLGVHLARDEEELPEQLKQRSRQADGGEGGESGEAGGAGGGEGEEESGGDSGDQSDSLHVHVHLIASCDVESVEESLDMLQSKVLWDEHYVPLTVLLDCHDPKYESAIMLATRRVQWRFGPYTVRSNAPTIETAAARTAAAAGLRGGKGAAAGGNAGSAAGGGGDGEESDWAVVFPRDKVKAAIFQRRRLLGCNDTAQGGIIKCDSGFGEREPAAGWFGFNKFGYGFNETGDGGEGLWAPEEVAQGRGDALFEVSQKSPEEVAQGRRDTLLEGDGGLGLGSGVDAGLGVGRHLLGKAAVVAKKGAAVQGKGAAVKGGQGQGKGKVAAAKGGAVAKAGSAAGAAAGSKPGGKTENAAAAAAAAGAKGGAGGKAGSSSSKPAVAGAKPAKTAAAAKTTGATAVPTAATAGAAQGGSSEAAALTFLDAWRPKSALGIAFYLRDSARVSPFFYRFLVDSVEMLAGAAPPSDDGSDSVSDLYSSPPFSTLFGISILDPGTAPVPQQPPPAWHLHQSLTVDCQFVFPTPWEEILLWRRSFPNTSFTLSSSVSHLKDAAFAISAVAASREGSVNLQGKFQGRRRADLGTDYFTKTCQADPVQQIHSLLDSHGRFNLLAPDINGSSMCVSLAPIRKQEERAKGLVAAAAKAKRKLNPKEAAEVAKAKKAKEVLLSRLFDDPQYALGKESPRVGTRAEEDGLMIDWRAGRHGNRLLMSAGGSGGDGFGGVGGGGEGGGGEGGRRKAKWGFRLVAAAKAMKRAARRVATASGLRRTPNITVPFSMEYGGIGYKQLLLKRTRLVGSILKMGYNVLLADVDAVWLSDPFVHMGNKSVDIYGQLEPSGQLCGGFLFLRSTPRVVTLWDQVTGLYTRTFNRMAKEALYKKPEEMGAWLKQFEHLHEQRYLNQLLGKRRNKVQVRGLDVLKFPNGKEFFVQRAPQQAEVAPVVIHNNYIKGKKQAEVAPVVIHNNYIKGGKECDHCGWAPQQAEMAPVVIRNNYIEKKVCVTVGHAVAVGCGTCDCRDGTMV